MVAGTSGLEKCSNNHSYSYGGRPPETFATNVHDTIPLIFTLHGPSSIVMLTVNAGTEVVAVVDVEVMELVETDVKADVVDPAGTVVVADPGIVVVIEAGALVVEGAMVVVEGALEDLEAV